ncbi:putative nucleotidyltransferase, ribonuclease H [Tanacetum coccineum]|uniref:Nucleotidyltransferase, ribonuclease H n=1 Tax=Tanacetum coccineum TaxID=301880 RepID=A0ABQ4Z7V8_9ASTR
MAIEKIDKNAASGSTVIDENRGRDDVHQNPKKKGMSKDVVASLDQRVAGVKASMAELKNQCEIHDLRDSFMGEITNIREEFGEEVSILHQVIEYLQADMALCKRSLTSGGGNTNHEMEQYLKGVNVVDDDSKIKMATRYLKDTTALWWRRRYGDIERGTATIDTWAEFVADFKKQFYPENAKNEAKSHLCKLKQSGTIREYVKEFTTLVLENPKLSDQDSLFYFLYGLQGWAKTELEQRGVQDLSTAIVIAEALIDFSTRRESSKPKDRKVNQEKGGGEKNAQPKVDLAPRDCPKKSSLNGLSAHGDEEASDGGSMGSIRILNAINAKTKVPKVVGKGLQYMEATINGVKVCALVNSGATYNFVADDEAKWLGINAMKGSGKIKAVNSLAKAIHGVAKDVRAKIGEWEGTIDLLVVPMDDFKVKDLHGEHGAGCQEWIEDPFGHAIQERIQQERALIFGGNNARDRLRFKQSEVPKAIERVLEEFKDVMPKELPKKLPPRRDVDHTIELETNDIVVNIHTLEEHVLHLKHVFQVLRDNELYVKLEKCSFAQAKVEFLGHKIKDGGLMMDGAKIKAIQDWESPTKVMKLRSFLGLVNYYRRFNMGYMVITSPLTDLLKKKKAWIWDEECQAAFESLKKAVMKEPVLRLPDVAMPFKLHTDASDFAIRGILMQDGHPIAFEIQKLNDTERRFVIETDNIATSYFQTQKKLSPKQARWQYFLHEFDYQLEYKPEKANVIADALSRKAEFAAITQAQLFLQDRIKEGLEHDPLAKKIIAFAKDGRTQRFWLKGDMLFTKGDRLYSRMEDDVETFVRTCLICQQDKIEQKKSGGLLEPLPTPKGPWESVSMDFITCLPKSKGGGSIIVVVDRFSKNGTFIAAPPDVIADDTAKLFFKNVVKFVQDHEDGFERLHEFSSLNGRENRDGECTIRALSSALYQVMVKLLPQQFKSLRKVHKGLIRRYEGPFPVIGRVRKLSQALSWGRGRPGTRVSKRAPTVVVTSYDREVEEILLDCTIRRRGVPSYKEYLIKWRDLPDSEASWEAEDLLWQFANEIKRYHEDGTTRTSRA